VPTLRNCIGADLKCIRIEAGDLVNRLEQILADAPVIPRRGTYGAANLRYGPKFDSGIKDLANPRFRKLVEQKFGVDLSKGHLLFSIFSPR